MEHLVAISILLILFVQVSQNICFCELVESSPGPLDNGNKFRLEGKVAVPSIADKDWVPLAKVLVDGGQYIGILKSDGSFVVSNIPSGSYVVEVTHPVYVFDPVRVEINSKGKTRARTLNNIQQTAMNALSYPLRFKARGQAQYFEKREQLRITDMIFNPMVMMMILPVFMMFVLPKLMSTQDPEVQREMQQMQSNMLQPQQNWDLAEMMTKLFGSDSSSSNSKKKDSKNKAVKKT